MTPPRRSIAEQVVQAEAIVERIDSQVALVTGLHTWADADCRPARVGVLRLRRGPVQHTGDCRTAAEALDRMRDLQARARAELQVLRGHAVRCAVLTAVHDAAAARAGEDGS